MGARYAFCKSFSGASDLSGSIRCGGVGLAPASPSPPARLDPSRTAGKPARAARRPRRLVRPAWVSKDQQFSDATWPQMNHSNFRRLRQRKQAAANRLGKASPAPVVRRSRSLRHPRGDFPAPASSTPSPAVCHAAAPFRTQNGARYDFGRPWRPNKAAGTITTSINFIDPAQHT